MKTRTEGKDTAARNRKGCIVEICIVLFFLLIALIPVVLLFSKWMQKSFDQTLVFYTAHDLPSEAEETEKNGTGSLTAEEARTRSIETTAPDAPARLSEESDADKGTE